MVGSINHGNATLKILQRPKFFLNVYLDIEEYYIQNYKLSLQTLLYKLMAWCNTKLFDD